MSSLLNKEDTCLPSYYCLIIVFLLLFGFPFEYSQAHAIKENITFHL